MKTGIMVAAVAAAAVVIVAAVLIVAAGGPAERGADSGPDDRQNEVAAPKYLGTYAKYNVSGKTGLVTVASGTATIEVIEETVIDGKTYIKIRCTYDIKSGSDRYVNVVESGLREIPDGKSATSVLYDGSDIVGTEKNMKVTVNGRTFRVNTTIYQGEFSGQPAKMWVGDSDDVVYKIETTVSGASGVASLVGVKLTCTLTSTNMI